MATNDWEIGAIYVQPGGPGGFWKQPDGVGGLVYPQQVQANADILTTEPFSELTGTYIFGCGHSQMSGTIYFDVDNEDGVRVALICCALCSFVQRVIKPWSDAVYGSVSDLQNAILYP
jgi:hypothetical protein